MTINYDLILIILLGAIVTYCIVVGIIQRFKISMPKFWTLSKKEKLPKSEKNYTDIDINMTVPCRGKNLDRQVGTYFARHENENDWEYVKRIFPVIFPENAYGALSILYGRPVEEITDSQNIITTNFLKRYYRSSIKKKKLYLNIFLQNFKNDPVQDL